MDAVGYFLLGGDALHDIGLPYWVVFVAAYLFVFGRSWAFYYAGRVAARGATGSRLSGVLASRRFGRATAALRRHGIVAVALCYVVIGTGSVVIVGAGFIDMPRRRFLVGLLPGSALWAITRLTVGLAVVNLLLAVVKRSPIAAAAVVAAVLLVVAVVVLRHRARSGR